MIRTIFQVLSLAALSLLPAHAVLISGSPDETAPTSSDIPNWTTGWGAVGITGWDYVGQVNGDSAVYLGNGWVLTAGHVGTGTFTLDTGPAAGTYTVTGASHTFGSADLDLFQISGAPSSTLLPALNLSLVLPIPSTAAGPGSTVAMLGFGDGGSQTHETWGYNTVTQTDQPVTVMVGSSTFNSTDFLTINGTSTYGSTSVTNNAGLSAGDSGGGDFTYDSAIGKWELIGINEGIGSGTLDGNSISFSAMVQLNAYDTQIESLIGIEAIPEPSTWTLLGLGLASVWGWFHRRSPVLRG